MIITRSQQAQFNSPQFAGSGGRRVQDFSLHLQSFLSKAQPGQSYRYQTAAPLAQSRINRDGLSGTVTLSGDKRKLTLVIQDPSDTNRRFAPERSLMLESGRVITQLNERQEALYAKIIRTTNEQNQLG